MEIKKWNGMEKHNSNWLQKYGEKMEWHGKVIGCKNMENKEMEWHGKVIGCKNMEDKEMEWDGKAKEQMTECTKSHFTL